MTTGKPVHLPERSRSGETATTLPAVYELIHAEPNESFRWHRHDYPAPVACWNHHPEYELHLITRGSGQAMIGDYIGSFAPRQLVLVGPNLPHAWFSALAPGETLVGRDVVLQFRESWVTGLIALCPELESLEAVLACAAQGLEFVGERALQLADALEALGGLSGAARLTACIDLLAGLSAAPFRTLAIGGGGKLSRPEMQRMNAVIQSLLASPPSGIRQDALARLAGMTPSVFSRRFRAATGDTFMAFVQKLRVNHACHLLATTRHSVTDIGLASGFNNLSNFNRTFLRLRGHTPRNYRRYSRQIAKLRAADSGVATWH